MSRSLISRWFQPQKFESMPGYTVEKRAADNMLNHRFRNHNIWRPRAIANWLRDRDSNPEPCG